MTDTTATGGGGVSPALRRAARLIDLPSLDYALGMLTGEWPKGGEMIRCPIPGHDDSTPSFNLWDEDDEGVPQRWGCFGCGRKGDVIDLVREFRGVTEDEALVECSDLAERERADGGKVDRKPREKKEGRPLQEILDEINMGLRELGILQAYMDSKGMSEEALVRFVMDEWEWGVNGRRQVVIPHRGPDSTLTGVKYRTLGGKKESERGSTYPFLYGSWRDRGRPRVLLCEGETDTVWASYWLQDEDIDVLGLPSGVSQTKRDEWVEQIGDRELLIALDGDEAGISAAKEWTKRYPEAMLVRVPEGEDLLSCGIPVKELLERAEVPRRSSGMIAVHQGVFGRRKGESVIPIADFAFEPVRELATDEGPAWEGYLSGDRRLVLLRSTDLLSAQTVTRWANRNGRAWLGGSGAPVQGVFNYLASESAFLPLERATSKAGKIGRSFVGPGFCIGADRVRYVPPALGDAKLNTRVLIERGQWDPRALLALERLNRPSTMAVILGWLCASLLRGKNAPAPPLFVAGESGAGKTNLIQTLLSSFGFKTEVNLTTTTPYGVDCLVNSCVGFPVWFDEYRGGAREDSMSRLRQLLRDAYYGQPSMKGGMTQQATELTEVSTWAGIIVSGEMSSQETSHRDRMVMLDLDPAMRNREAYAWLQDARRTRGLGHDLLTFLAKRPESLFKVVPAGPATLPDRFRDTMGFVQAGWDAWLHFRLDQGMTDAPEAPDLTMLATGRAEAEDPWLQALKACEGVSTRDGDVIVEQVEGGYRVIPTEVIVEARRIGIELPARANELVGWLKNRYKVSDTRTLNRRRAKMVEGLEL